MKKTFFFFVKIVISVLVLYFLIDRIYHQKAEIITSLEVISTNYSTVFLVVLLMPLNWFLEVVKWRVSLKPIVTISYKQAAAGILSGVSLGFITPHAIGDYFARIWSFNHKDRKKAIVPILITRSAQLLPTLCFGLLCILNTEELMLFHWQNAHSSYSLIMVSSSVLISLLLLYLLVRYSRVQQSITAYINMFFQMKALSYVKIILLSFARYFVFSAQFIVLLSPFMLDLTLVEKFYGVSFVFLLKSILPTFNFLSDLGIREFSAVLYFEALNINAAPIILASLLLWCINIVIPALAGLYFVKDFKIEGKR